MIDQDQENAASDVFRYLLSEFTQVMAEVNRLSGQNFGVSANSVKWSDVDKMQSRLSALHEVIAPVMTR